MKSPLLALCAIFSLCLFLFSSCAPASRPVQAAHYEIGYCKSYDQAWNVARDVLVAHEFVPGSAQKGDGYYRTEWLYRRYAKPDIDIRVRFILNYLPDRAVVRVTPDVEYFTGETALHREIPVVSDVLAELDQRLRCAGDEAAAPAR